MEVGDIVHCVNAEDQAALEIHKIKRTHPLKPKMHYRIKAKVDGIFVDGVKPALALEDFDEGLFFWENLFEEIA